MKRKKLSNKTKGKLLIVIPILLFVGILIVTFVATLISNFDPEEFRKLRLFWQINGFFENGYHWPIIILLSIWVGLLLLRFIIDHVLPMLHFFIGKPFKYFAVWRICRKNGYSCHFRRLGGVELWLK